MGEERRRRGWGGGAGRRVWVSPTEGVGGVGAAGKRVWVSFAAGAGGVGAAGKSAWVAAGGGAGKGCWREVRWLKCGRQGRGNKFPLPVSLSPNGDIPTVQCQGIGGKEPDTAFHRLYPGYGCSPDIASTAPAPGRGGGGAPKARVGWGCRQKSMGILLRRRGRGGGCRQKGMGIFCRRRGRGGGVLQGGKNAGLRQPTAGYRS